MSFDSKVKILHFLATIFCFGVVGKGAWPNNSVSLLERAFGEISRSLDRCSNKDQDVFFALGGFDILARIYKVLLPYSSPHIQGIATIF